MHLDRLALSRMLLKLYVGIILQLGEILSIHKYQMEDWCGDEIDMRQDTINQGQITLPLQKSYTKRTVRGAAGDLSCWSTVKSNDKKLMFYIESLNLPCNIGYLDFYDGSPNYHLTIISGLEKLCGHYVPSRVFTTTTPFLTVNYSARHPEDSNTDAINLVFTSYRTGLCPSSRYLCDNGRCISADLACNGFRSCGDGSVHCPAVISSAAIAGIVLGSIILVCLVVTISILISICRRRQILRRNSEIFTTRQSQGIVNPMYSNT